MSFKDITLKAAYDTGRDNPLEEFYIPVLKETVKYDRITGFFSSSSLAISARGIAGLLMNNGKMRILTCPKLNKDDIDVILSASKNPEEYISNIIINDLNEITDEFQNDHIKALGWMIANNLLEIRIAIITEIDDEEELAKAIFHQKVGILYDKEGNSLSFSGSLNETAMGWLKNIEEFKVFKEWIDGQYEFYQADKLKFESYWNNRVTGVKVIGAPQAVINKLVEIGKGFDKDNFCLKKYKSNLSKKEKISKISLHWYQEKGLEKWKNNNYSLLFEMATGTGKTRTALSCLEYLITTNQNLVCVISSPQTTLSHQWDTEVDNLSLSSSFDSKIFADSTNKWRPKLEEAINKISIGYIHRVLIYTTHKTASSIDFINYIQSIKEEDIPLCLIGDEAHGLGATETKRALLPNYKFRIGLSATPKRWFDDYGTAVLEEFFGNESYQFSIHDALTEINPLNGKTFLVPYYYNPVPVYLTDEELERYNKLSKKISKLSNYSKTSDSYQKIYQKIKFERAKIIKSAINKINEFPKTISKIIENNGIFEDTLIFVDDTNMLEKVLKIMSDKEIISHKITKDEGISERKYIISKFKEKKYKAIIAIKCMDEGIDIPTASTAIIMSSSTNPREYIQRIGRVIRRSDDKKRAYIYDFIVVPDITKIEDPNLRELEIKIFEKEKIRIEAIASEAINNGSVLIKLNSILDGNNNVA